MIQFHKLHSLGNDFLLLDQQQIELHHEFIKRIGDRYLGVGFDQCLVIEPIDGQETWRYTIFNQDGSKANQCLNGARAVGLYLAMQYGLKKVMLQSETEQIWVNMNKLPQIEVRVDWPKELEKPQEGWFYELGNPHWIIDFTQKEWRRSAIEAFYKTRSVNVSGLYRHHDHEISLCTFERGVGLTNACGSACVAAFAALHDHELCASTMTIFQKGGAIELFKSDNKSCSVAGARWVFSGEMDVSRQQIFNQSGSTQYRYHGFKEIL